MFYSKVIYFLHPEQRNYLCKKVNTLCEIKSFVHGVESFNASLVIASRNWMSKPYT